MTARAAVWDIAGCGPSVRADGGGGGLDVAERLKGLAATAAGIVDDVVVVGLWKECVGVDAVATGEVEFRSISVSSEKSKLSGEWGRVGTS